MTTAQLSTSSPSESTTARLRRTARTSFHGAVQSVGERAERISDDALSAGRRVWLAGLGAGLGTIGALDEQRREIFDQLVDRGRAAERAPETSPLRPLHRARREAESVGHRVERMVEDTVTHGLRRLGVPARRDFDQLAAQVERLTRKVQTVAEADAA